MKPICKIDECGDKHWRLNGLLHREDGPAYEGSSGAKFWYINGIPHREDGPAMEYSSGYKQWYYKGKKINCENNQEFLRMIKLMVFL